MGANNQGLAVCSLRAINYVNAGGGKPVEDVLVVYQGAETMRRLAAGLSARQVHGFTHAIAEATSCR